MVLDTSGYPKGRITFTAGFWPLLRARIFGKKYEGRAGRYYYCAYFYKGTYYFTRYGAL